MADVDPLTHQKLAADAFNETWRFLDKAKRTPEEDARMVELAHVSRDHWATAGMPVHWARGEWQLSRVYSAIGQPETAMQHAQRCLQIAEQNSLGDFDRATAHEAYVRAYRASGDLPSARDEYAKALALAGRVIEPEDRAVLFMDLREHARALEIPWEDRSRTH